MGLSARRRRAQSDSSQGECTLPTLLALPRHDDELIRWRASSGLEVAGAVAVPALIDALHDEEPRIRRMAVSTLAGIGKDDTAVVPALIGALADEDAIVRLSTINSRPMRRRWTSRSFVQSSKRR